MNLKHITITSYNICNIKQKARSRGRCKASGSLDEMSGLAGVSAQRAETSANPFNLVYKRTMSKQMSKQNGISPLGNYTHLLSEKECVSVLDVEKAHQPDDFSGSSRSGDGVLPVSGNDIFSHDGKALASISAGIIDGFESPDGAAAIGDSSGYSAQCSLSVRVGQEVQGLPPGFVAISDLVPVVLADLTSAARLIHDSPAPVDGENGQRSVNGSSETATGADQGIVSKSKTKAALSFPPRSSAPYVARERMNDNALPPQIRIDDVARKVSKFAKMLDVMPLSLRNEDARQALRLELVEYRDRLGFLLETSCLPHVTETPSSLTNLSFPAPLITSYNSGLKGKFSICNIKQKCGKPIYIV